MSASPSHGHVCSLRGIVRNMGTLSQAAAERNVLARNLVERDHEIVPGDLGSRHNAVIQVLQQCQPLLFGTSEPIALWTKTRRPIQSARAIRSRAILSGLHRHYTRL